MSILEKYDEVMDCYFSTVYHSPPAALSHLCLTQALEAYHGIKYQSHHQHDFHGKLEEIVTACSTIFPGTFPDIPEFTATVRDNRNYYTHHNPKWRQGGRVVSGGNLCLLNIKLKILVQACLLTEMGIPADRMRRLLRQLDVKIIDFI